MGGALNNSSGFPTARCEPCGKSVLTYVAFDDAGDEFRCCVHCDAPVGPDLDWIAADELEARGYDFGEPPPKDAHGGCGGGGCSSCSIKRRRV